MVNVEAVFGVVAYSNDATNFNGLHQFKQCRNQLFELTSQYNFCLPGGTAVASCTLALITVTESLSGRVMVNICPLSFHSVLSGTIGTATLNVTGLWNNNTIFCSSKLSTNALCVWALRSTSVLCRAGRVPRVEFLKIKNYSTQSSWVVLVKIIIHFMFVQFHPIILKYLSLRNLRQTQHSTLFFARKVFSGISDSSERSLLAAGSSPSSAGCFMLMGGWGGCGGMAPGGPMNPGGRGGCGATTLNGGLGGTATTHLLQFNTKHA